MLTWLLTLPSKKGLGVRHSLSRSSKTTHRGVRNGEADSHWQIDPCLQEGDNLSAGPCTQSASAEAEQKTHQTT